MKQSQVLVILGLGVLLCVMGIRIDNDAWFLLNHGRYVAEYGLPHVEPFTIHEGFHFVMQQWLFALALWKIYSLAGIQGLWGVSFIAAVVILLLYYHLVQLADGGNTRISCWLTAVTGAFIVTIFICQRPQIASSTIFLLEIYYLEKYRVDCPKYVYVIFLLLSMLLINVHAAMWPMMLVFLLPYICESLWGERLSWCESSFHWPGKALLLMVLLIIAGGFLNPYGTEAMTYTWHSYGYKEINEIVGEMKPMALGNPLKSVCLLIMFGLTAVYARCRLPLRYLLLAVGTGFLALSAVRSFFLFLLFGTLPLAYILRNARRKPKAALSWPQWCRGMLFMSLTVSVCLLMIYRSRGADVAAPGLLAYILAVLLGLGWLRGLYRAWQWRRRDDWQQAGNWSLICLVGLFLVAAMSLQGLNWETVPWARERGTEVLLADSPAADIVAWTGYNDGDYLEFNGIRCYMDTRAEVFIPSINQQKDVLAEYIALLTGRLDYRDFVACYHFTHFWTTKSDPLYTYLAHDPDYVLLWDSEQDATAPQKIMWDEDKIRIYAYRPQHNRANP